MNDKRRAWREGAWGEDKVHWLSRRQGGRNIWSAGRGARLHTTGKTDKVRHKTFSLVLRASAQLTQAGMQARASMPGCHANQGAHRSRESLCGVGVACVSV